MGIQIGAKPDSGFDDPIGMLKDCHRRIEQFLHILCVVVERAQGRTLTAEESAALHAALTYFQVGGQRHTADEEQSLFPRLQSLNATEELDRLENDHSRAADLHVQVEQLYQRWISLGSLSDPETRHLLDATAQLRALYDAHIAVEDNIIFPRAKQILDSGTISTIGEEFRARRL